MSNNCFIYIITWKIEICQWTFYFSIFYRSIVGLLLNFLAALSLGLIFMWLPKSVNVQRLMAKVNTLSLFGITRKPKEINWNVLMLIQMNWFTSQFIVFTNDLKSIFSFQHNNSFDSNVWWTFGTGNHQQTSMIVSFCNLLV